MINLFKSWFTIDKRILGLYRIFFGILILADILRRWDTRHIFYSNHGVVHHYNSSSYFSLLNIFNDILQPWIIDWFFILGVFFSVLFIIGYKTKLSHLIIGTILLSLHNRVVLVENAGDFVMNCMLIWTFFLPLGAAISIDSLKSDLKKTNDTTTNDLNIKSDKKSYNYTTIAYFAILFQISAIYFFTGLNKTGKDWVSGTAVYYFYQLDTFLTPFGALIRDYVGVLFSKVATYSTLALEISIPLLLFFPIYTIYLRRFAVLSLIVFHLIIMSSLSIGLFSQTMIVSFILLLDGKLIDSLKKYFNTNKKYILFYDSDCGFCHYTVRIIKRIDIFNSIQFDNQNAKIEKPKHFNELIKNTAIVFDPKSNKMWIKHLAFAKIISLLPLGFIISWTFYLPGITILLEKAYDVIAKNRTKISTSLGLAACDVKSLDNKEKQIDDMQTTTSYFNCRKIIYLLNSLVVSILLFACINYNLVANESVNEYMEKYGFEKFQHTKTLRKIMSYPRMIQRWNMFSPSVLKRDKWLVVEAQLSDGTIIDPFTGKPPVLDSVDYEFLWEDINQFWRKYFTRIEKKKSQIDRLKKWILHPENKYFEDKIGNKKIESVNLWFLTQKNGAPNSDKEYKVYKKELPKKHRKRNKSIKKTKDANILDIIKKNNEKRKK